MKSAEKIKNVGCGTIIFAIGLTQVANPKIYEMAYKKRGEPGLHEVLNIFEESLKDKPLEIIDNPEKVLAMRAAVETSFNGEEQQIEKQAALKVVEMYMKRLVSKGLLTENEKETTRIQALIDYGVAAGEATRATLGIGRIITYSMPGIRNVASGLEIKKYGTFQELPTPELFDTVIDLVK